MREGYGTYEADWSRNSESNEPYIQSSLLLPLISDYKACKKTPCFEYLGSSKQHTEKFSDYIFLYDQVRLCKSCTCDTGKSCFLK